MSAQVTHPMSTDARTNTLRSITYSCSGADHRVERLRLNDTIRSLIALEDFIDEHADLNRGNDPDEPWPPDLSVIELALYFRVQENLGNGFTSRILAFNLSLVAVGVGR